MLGLVKKEEAATLASALEPEEEEPPEVVRLVPAEVEPLDPELPPELDPPEKNEGKSSVERREVEVLAAWGGKSEEFS